MASLSHSIGWASEDRKSQIEEAARKRYEKDHPKSKGWDYASHWIKESYRDEVQKAPR